MGEQMNTRKNRGRITWGLACWINGGHIVLIFGATCGADSAGTGAYRASGGCASPGSEPAERTDD